MATSTPDLPPALAAGLRAAVRGVASLYRSAACSVAVVTADGDGLRFIAAHGAGEAEITGVTVSRGTGIAGWVVSSGTSLAVADVRRDPRFAAETARTTGYVPSTILAAPLLRDDGEAIGVTEVLDPQARERDLDLLALVGSLLALPLTQALPRSSALHEAVDAVEALGPDAEDLAVALLRAVTAHQGRPR
jgi:signal transduction protein with GAF and PtsI domain